MNGHSFSVKQMYQTNKGEFLQGLTALVLCCIQHTSEYAWWVPLLEILLVAGSMPSTGSGSNASHVTSPTMSGRLPSSTSIHPALGESESNKPPSTATRAAKNNKSDDVINPSDLPYSHSVVSRNTPADSSSCPFSSTALAAVASSSSGPATTQHHLLSHVSSNPLPLSLNNLALADAKHILRHVDQSQPFSIAAALVSPIDSAPADGPRRNSRSHESVPRQTLIKALASSVNALTRNHKPEALMLPGMYAKANAQAVSGSSSADVTISSRPGSASPAHLTDALNDLAHHNTTTSNPPPGSRAASASASSSLQPGPQPPGQTPTTAFPGSLQSPCFYHERFDDAVDIDKVLEEIKNDEWMSHSRLVQTATGVREVSKQLQRRPIKRAVRNVMIVTKARDNTLVLLTRELAQWLLRTPRYGSDLGVNVFVDAKLRASKRFDAQGIVAENPRFQHMLKYWTPDLCWSKPEKFDLVLTLGGDGTVLFTSWLFQRIVPPTLSFSLGSLGFLTTFEYDRFRDHLNRVMGNDGMKINLRMRFTCTVYRNGMLGREMEEGEQFEVLNELVIDRGPSPYVSNLELYGDNELLTVVQADGCIFSTPTGKVSSRFVLTMNPHTNTLHFRFNSLLPLRRRLPRTPRHPRHPPHPHLPTHALLPSHGPLRHHAPAGHRAAQFPRDRLLRLRRQGPRRAEARRLRDHHGIAVPLSDGDANGHGVVRQREPHPAVEHARGNAEGV